MQTPQVAASHVGLQVDHHNGSHTAGHDDLLPLFIVSSPHLHKPRTFLSQDNTKVTLLLLPINPNMLAKSCCKHIMLSHTLMQAIIFFATCPSHCLNHTGNQCFCCNVMQSTIAATQLTDQSLLGGCSKLSMSCYHRHPQPQKSAQAGAGGGGVGDMCTHGQTKTQSKSSVTVIS